MHKTTFDLHYGCVEKTYRTTNLASESIHNNSIIASYLLGVYGIIIDFLLVGLQIA